MSFSECWRLLPSEVLDSKYESVLMATVRACDDVSVARMFIFSPPNHLQDARYGFGLR